ncbi:class I SAM-dependent methyltransferase [Sphingomonas crocodyli]|uniref:Class I SAM-dependent methyltransferase n=1 Tax=Sphingomonas crocodyli TaxID=1979270 RepID=A0A437MBB7_9SPHN|nr:class I SAM-dependent methyltransferase [Sphingomonas crocodyli]RVT94944.1 class I SAM-dependent methyltransferase [Sphingomonas crocodyli]
MTALREELVARLWRGSDPFAHFPASIYQVDKQGWNKNHHYLTEAIGGDRQLVVEIGVWKGGSTIAMAERMRELGVDGAVIAVDTWLGSVEHWVEEQWTPHLGLVHGYPSIQRKFMANVTDSCVQDYVVPLPSDSINASEIIKWFGIQADVIHIDAGHDYASVMADLSAWWPVLKPGGLYIGDDYHENGVHWPGVYDAHNDFFSAIDVAEFEFVDGKCRLRKTV